MADSLFNNVTLLLRDSTTDLSSFASDSGLVVGGGVTVGPTGSFTTNAINFNGQGGISSLFVKSDSWRTVFGASAPNAACAEFFAKPLTAGGLNQVLLTMGRDFTPSTAYRVAIANGYWCVERRFASGMLWERVLTGPAATFDVFTYVMVKTENRAADKSLTLTLQIGSTVAGTCQVYGDNSGMSFGTGALNEATGVSIGTAITQTGQGGSSGVAVKERLQLNSSAWVSSPTGNRTTLYTEITAPDGTKYNSSALIATWNEGGDIYPGIGPGVNNPAAPLTGALAIAVNKNIQSNLSGFGHQVIDLGSQKFGVEFAPGTARGATPWALTYWTQAGRTDEQSIPRVVTGANPAVNRQQIAAVTCSTSTAGTFDVSLSVGGFVMSATAQTAYGALQALQAALPSTATATLTALNSQTAVLTITTDSFGPVPIVASAAKRVEANFVGSLNELRITAADARYSGAADVPGASFDLNGIPPAPLGGALPANVILAVNSENGFRDVSAYNQPPEPLSGPTTSIVGSGSRTGDKYLRNTDGAANIDATSMFAVSPQVEAVWAAATSMTEEYDVRVDAVPHGNTYFLRGTAITAYQDGYVLSPDLASVSTQKLEFGVWYHVAACFDGATTLGHVFVNGVQVPPSPATTAAFNNAGVSFGVYGFAGVMQVPGRQDLASLQGGLDNLVYTASAKYTADFAPPGAITGGWVIPSDALLATNFEGGFQDLSQYTNPVTTALGSSVSIQSSGSRTNDGYARNTNGALNNDVWAEYAMTGAAQAAWAAASAATIEFDLLVTAVPVAGNQILGVGASEYMTLTNIDATTCTLAFVWGDTISTAITKNSWHHVAIVLRKTGPNYVMLYVDGVLAATSTSSVVYSIDTGQLPTFTLFQFQSTSGGGAGSLQGGFDNLQVTSSAKYAADFTPPGAVGLVLGGGTADVTGAGYALLDDLTGSGQGNTQEFRPNSIGSSFVTLDDFTCITVTGITPQVTGTGSATLGTWTSAGSGIHPTPTNVPAISQTLGDYTNAGAGRASIPTSVPAIDQTTDDFVSQGLGMLQGANVGTGESLLPDFVHTVLTAEVTTPNTATVNVSVMPLLTAYTGSRAKVAVSDYGLIAVASPKVPVAVAAVAYAPTLAARVGTDVALTGYAATLTSAATNINVGRVNVTAQLATLDATARAASSSEVNVSYPGTYALVGYAGSVVSVTTAAGTVSASGKGGTVATVLVEAPLAELTASATQINVARADLVGPALVPMNSGRAFMLAPGAVVTAIGSAVVAVTKETYVLNMSRPQDDNPRNNFEAKVDQMTRYTNYPFTQILRYMGSYYGVAADGLYLLEGTTDNGTPIDWNFETCMTDFGTSEKKNVASTYLGGQAGPTVNYTIKSGGSADQLHASTITATAVQRNHRQKYGLGRRERYYALGVAGQGDVAVDSIEFEVSSTTRRI